MCGIVGIVSQDRSQSERERIVKKMAASIAHRGPDGTGLVSCGECTLGFQRLAIMDLDAESPPFSTELNSVWSVCNGQIYNAPELRRHLAARGHRLRTGTDTEVIPHVYEQSGLDFVNRLSGMFAIALWDGLARRLILARDRAGEKPLFYWKSGSELAFASEIRALRMHPDCPDALDPVAIRRYLLHDYFPAPYTPISGIRKLPAGHVLVSDPRGTTTRCYWDLSDYFGSSSLQAVRESDLAPMLDEQIGRAVRSRSRSDVPFGVFLSGGIDSATILSHLADEFGDGVPAFSIGHEDDEFDESERARSTARHFGADFHPLVLGRSDLERGLAIVASRFDEPLGDASTIPTHLLSLHARDHVKVVLSGEGADELFAGYPTYLGARIAEGYRRLPAAARSSIASAARLLVPHSMGNVGVDYLVERFLAGAGAPTIERHHTWFGSMGPVTLDAVLSPRMVEAIGGDDVFWSARRRVSGRAFPDALSKLLYTDFTMYLQDGLLTKVDRAAMLASLEARAPFLDHELVEFAATIPSHLKLRGITTKAVLRDAVRHRLPNGILQRRKRGFNIPFSKWLLDGLGHQLRRRFSPERVSARGLLRSSTVNRILDEHMAGQADHRKPLFTLMMLDLWCDRVYGVGMRVPIAHPSRTPRNVRSIVPLTRYDQSLDAASSL
jgi:asparagine synthase (glutamine-hydrolysing)